MCGMEEDTEHIIRLCPAARVVWRRLGCQDIDIIQGGNLREWVLHNLDEHNLKFGEEWALVFAVSVWWLWRWRNARSFE